MIPQGVDSEKSLGSLSGAVERGSLPLFRRAALSARQMAEFGQPIALMPVSWHLLTGLCLLLFVLAVVFLSTHTIVRKETVMGVLSMSLGELRVTPPSPGVISSVLVKDGQHVAAGEALVTVTTEHVLGLGESFGKRMDAVLDDEERSLVDRLATLEREAPIQLRAIEGRLKSDRERLRLMAQSQESRMERLAAARATYESSLDSLKRGLITSEVLRQRHYDFLAQQTAMSELESELARTEGSIAENEGSFQKAPQEYSKARAELQNALAVLEEKRLEARRARGYMMVAQVSGRVTNLQARAGQPADARHPLMTVVPDGSELQAILYVPSRAAGFVRPGNKVRLLYDSFPYQQFGASEGFVEGVSATVLRPEEIEGSVKLEEPVYRVTVHTTKQSVNAYGREVPLRAGTALTADLLLEERSFFRLLIEPLIASGRRVLGDS
jgi:membrane fusion protein